MRPEVQEPLARLFPETWRHYARCLKKMGYITPEAAEHARQRRQPHTEEVLRVYGPCDDCGLWHLTHHPMTAAQVKAEEAALQAELTQLDATLAQLRARVRPFIHVHAMRGISRHEIDAAFREQWELLGEIERTWLAALQRTLLLRRSQIPDRRAAQRLDREAQRFLEEQRCIFAENRRRHGVLYAKYCAELAQSITEAVPLPRYDWRRYLTA